MVRVAAYSDYRRLMSRRTSGKMHSIVFVLIFFPNYMLAQVKTPTPPDTIATATTYLKGQEGHFTNCSAQDACALQVVYACPRMHMKVCLQVNLSVKHHLSES